MLPAKNRLSREEISLVIAKGRSFRGDLLTWVYLPLNPAKPSRFAFVVSARLIKKAVTRHKIKRQLRLAVAKALTRVKLGWGMVIFLKKNLTDEQIKTLNEISLPRNLLSSAL